jgi:hypothetical protein
VQAIEHDPAELEELDISGLFDAAWYLLENSDVRASGLDPLSHFCRYGWREGRRPNLISTRGITSNSIRTCVQPI